MASELDPFHGIHRLCRPGSHLHSLICSVDIHPDLAVWLVKGDRKDMESVIQNWLVCLCLRSISISGIVDGKPATGVATASKTDTAATCCMVGCRAERND